jgi:hypothetical protein
LGGKMVPMGSSRVMPVVGMRAVVQHLAKDIDAVVREVTDEGRTVTVETVDGEWMVFRLRRATGRFHAAGSGPRLRLRP